MSTTSLEKSSASDSPVTIRLQKLESRIRTVWRRSQWLHFSRGLFILLIWLSLLFGFGVAVDWCLSIPAAGRGLYLIGLVVFSVYRAWKKAWKAMRFYNSIRAAIQLENHHQGLESLLVSALQFRDLPPVTGASESLRQMTLQRAEEAAVNLHPEKAMPFDSLRQPLVSTLVLAGLIGFFALFGSAFLAAGLSRIFTPWLIVNYPTYTQLEIPEGNLLIKQGASVRIKGNVSGVVPKTAKLFLQTGDARPREILLDIINGQCEYSVASTSRDFSYRIKAGDFLSSWYSVTVVPPPRVEKVQVKLEFPEYMQRATETVEGLTLTVPEGTTLQWELGLDRPIRQGFFVRDGEEPVELQVTEEGNFLQFNTLASDSRGYFFSWIDRAHGFEFNSPRYFLQVSSDQAPQVEITSPSANLVAMLGRPMTIAMRARDDHGFAMAKVVYRVNRRPENTFTFPGPVQNGEGEQVINWDYRTALPELQIGDTLSFRVEVRDRYPGPEGPHLARSETRRITFLSQEEYLKQIEEKKNRLLSYVRTIYRQERVAHELVRNLNPALESFTQSCQLEAIRQEMVRTQLNGIAGQIRGLLEDLAANNVSDAPQSESLEHVSSTLKMVADTQIAAAANLLRAQVGTDENKLSMRTPMAAASMVNAAARELGSLVLMRDIESAQEVFARETHMFAQVQASLRFRMIRNEPGAEAILNEQSELGIWVSRLISDLQANMHYKKRPLAVLRLTRSIKSLRDKRPETTTRRVTELIRAEEIEQALALQAELVRIFLNAEFSVRLSGAYSTLMQTRNALKYLIVAQTRLNAETAKIESDASPDQIEQQQLLRKQLLTLLLPTVPAPRAQLFDQAMPEAPPVEKMLTEANLAMAAALSHFKEKNLSAVKAAQLEVEQILVSLLKIVERWAVETGLQTQGLGTLVAASSERLSRVEEYEAKVVGLIDSTDIAAAEKQQLDSLVTAQEILIEDIGQFLNELQEQNQEGSQQDLPPLISRLEQATVFLESGVNALKKNAAEVAVDQQEQAADALGEAFAMVTAQYERLSLLQDLLMFQRSVGFAKGYMADIVAEQRDLLAATNKLDGDDLSKGSPELSKLIPVFQHLYDCMEEVAPLLDLVAARLDVGTPLAFAKTDFEDAMASLEAGDKLDAMDAQDVAAESLGEVQQLVSQIQVQTGYVAEVVEFLHSKTSETAMLRYRQRSIRSEGDAADSTPLVALQQRQMELITDAQRNASQLAAVTGIPEFQIAVEEMKLVRDHFAANETSSAIEQMELAEVALEENDETLFTVISVLHGLPSIEIAEQTDPALIRLIEVLAVASEHQLLLRRTADAGPQEIVSLAGEQKDLASRCKTLAETGESNRLLTAASGHLSNAVAVFETGDQPKRRKEQNDANRLLRHFIVEQALILETAKPPAAASEGDPGDDGEGSDGESEFAAGFISDFVSGEAPKDKRTGWKVLGERNRASLNQNFARELPLEYRGLLKNYYERVAK